MRPIVWIIYDCPLKNCSKSWIHEGLQKLGYKTCIIEAKSEISHIEQRGTVGKVAARIITLKQCVEALIKSNPGDIVLCWSNFAGLYFNMLPGSRNRKIISYNWLTPTPRKQTLFLYHNALSNPNLRATVNSIENKDRLLCAYEVDDIGNIFYIPDVYDDSEGFERPQYIADTENRYCFMGGRANRDWDMFLLIAKNNPQLKFIGVAVSSDWDNSRVIPENVTMYYDVPAKRYYELLENSYLAIYPLKEDRVAGLVNIVKSIQKGIMVVVSDIPATKMYYEEKLQTLLPAIDDAEGWNESLKIVYAYSKEEYEEAMDCLQKHLKEKFSPEYAITNIDTIIKSFE